ncbi:MurR/RpiR family transcriptional regulator [Rhodococcus opacus]|uniref:MurR/RpiR family transcriptional regulator n=1 Tax=Rhodococcus opacus TaxID=37919 RepID=UPI001C442835|nr:MurR/RpiR family transcriptional regulator [Rhodococcus opacus]MBV6756916.1 MurR/RpiR family transcriptional regulator [Rhodococcus opacus]
MSHGSADPWRSSTTLARLRAGLATLGPGEQRVARVVLAEPAAVVELSTAELASASGTSPATVVRACQRLGFRGFQHLRLELARVTPDPEAAAATPVDTAFRAAAEALTATRATIDPAGFAAVVDLIVRARRILLVGNGFSSPPIQDAALRFTTVGRSVEAPLDILGQQFSARLLTDRDVCLAVSYSGANTHTLRACAAARDRDAAVVAITSYSNTPLTRISDHVLWAGAGVHENEADSFSARISQLTILYALQRAVLGHPEQQAVDTGARDVVADALSDSLPDEPGHTNECGARNMIDC